MGIIREWRIFDATVEIRDAEERVLVIGAGGAGLRAAIEAAARGCRSASSASRSSARPHRHGGGRHRGGHGHVWPEDQLASVHFATHARRKMLNNWRMAQLHAQESPERVLELERYGALFDRTQTA